MRIHYRDLVQLIKEAVEKTVPHRVFVYGTLKRGQPNHYRIKGSTFVSKANAIGLQKYNSQETGPAAVKKPGEENFVQGELYLVLPDILQEIDEYEAPDYKRQMIKLEDGSLAEAWLKVI